MPIAPRDQLGDNSLILMHSRTYGVGSILLEMSRRDDGIIGIF